MVAHLAGFSNQHKAWCWRWTGVDHWDSGKLQCCNSQHNIFPPWKHKCVGTGTKQSGGSSVGRLVTAQSRVRERIHKTSSLQSLWWEHRKPCHTLSDRLVHYNDTDWLWLSRISGKGSVKETFAAGTDYLLPAPPVRGLLVRWFKAREFNLSCSATAKDVGWHFMAKLTWSVAYSSAPHLGTQEDGKLLCLWQIIKPLFQDWFRICKCCYFCGLFVF